MFLFIDKSEFCYTVDYCHEVTCNGHGTCQNIEIVTNTNCITNCYDSVHDCEETCFPVTRRTYQCTCDERWTGTDCELMRCTDGLTCYNAGTCSYVHVLGTPSCVV